MTLTEAITTYGEAFEAYWNNNNYTSTDDQDALVSEAIEAFNEHFHGIYDSLRDWAEEFVDDTGLLDGISQNLRYYFDYEAYARDCKLGGDIYTLDIPGGVAVFWNR